MNFITNDILVACFCHSDEVNNTIIKTNQDFIWSAIIWETNGLLRVSFRPYFDKFGGLKITLPSLDTSYFHELCGILTIPGHFSIGDFSIESVDWAGICGCD